MALADCSAAFSVYAHLAQCHVTLCLYAFQFTLLSCLLVISTWLLSWICPERSPPRLGKLMEEKGNVSWDNSRTEVGQLSAAGLLSVVSFYCRECSNVTFGLLRLFMGYCVILSIESYLFLLSRAKMTTAPYNYSYIFKYIIIGKWAACFPLHVHCFIKRTIYYINVL